MYDSGNLTWNALCTILNRMQPTLPLVVVLVLLFSCSSSNGPKDRPISQNKNLMKGDCRVATTYLPAKSLTRNALVQAGCVECQDQSAWRSTATSSPAFLLLKSKSEGSFVLVNHQAALLLEKKKIIRLPSLQMAIDLSKRNYTKTELLSAFRNQKSDFINFNGKMFDLKVYSIWIDDNTTPSGKSKVLNVSPSEGRVYISEGLASNGYLLRTIKNKTP